MTAYYNENDPKAAQWIRELIRAGHIAYGHVDERSIEDVPPIDLFGYAQCHFFAGIGGWSLALRMAGWPDDRPVWTGSCPCQPFSQAGKGAGVTDERHLWPAFHHLIDLCDPAVVFGEQVASAAGLEWLAAVQADLEASGYATGAADLCAAGVGAPHIRQRLYWVGERLDNAASNAQPRPGSCGGEQPSGVADASCQRQQQHAQRDGEQVAGIEASRRADVDGCSDDGEQPSDVGHTDDAGSQGRSERRYSADQRSPWAAELVSCRDGRRRPVEPGTFPLAHGVPDRVGLLRGYGNAIVPQVAAAFIGAYLESTMG